MSIEFCPRCGTKRPDYLKWCRKCGLDFEMAERGKLPANMVDESFQRPSGQQAAEGQALPHGSGWTQGGHLQADITPVSDRRNIARWSRNALDVRCGGTAGGCLGTFVGFLVGGYVGLAIGGLAVIFTLAVGAFLGMYLGMRIALGLMAR